MREENLARFSGWWLPPGRSYQIDRLPLVVVRKERGGIQRVELLIEPVLGRDPGVDGAADRFDRRSLHDRVSPMASRSSLPLRPKKRGPFQLVPVMAKATLERLS